MSAVRWHSIGELVADRVVRFLAPGSHASRRHSFVVVRRTRRPDPHPWERPPLRVCSRPRALIDAAREMRSPTAARDLLLPAVQQRHVREQDLWAELEAGPSRGSAPVRAALREVATGAWSRPEVDMLTVLAASPRLPRIWPNPVLQVPDGTVLPTPDGWVDELGPALQMQSRRHHLRDEDWEATIETGTIFGEYGVPVIGTTPKALDDDPDRFVRRVESTYAHLRRSGHRPAVG